MISLVTEHLIEHRHHQHELASSIFFYFYSIVLILYKNYHIIMKFCEALVFLLRFNKMLHLQLLFDICIRPWVAYESSLLLGLLLLLLLLSCLASN